MLNFMLNVLETLFNNPSDIDETLSIRFTVPHENEHLLRSIIL